MSERVRVLHDDDGRLVAAKAAPGFDPTRAEREAAVLGQLQHPGVVELVGLRPGPSGPEVWTRWVGSRSAADLARPLAPARAAGLALAVGATLVDLHRVGIVHGAVEATHVLLDPHGRPVLCGFGRAAALDRPLGPLDDGDDTEPLTARPSVDVAGLGHLLLELLDDDGPATSTRRGALALRGGRSRSGQARALRDVAAQATVPDPRDRPGLHAVLDGIRRAVPDAVLSDEVGVPDARVALTGTSPSAASTPGRGAAPTRTGNDIVVDDDPVSALLRAVLEPDRDEGHDTADPPGAPSGSGPDRWDIDGPAAGPSEEVRIAAPRAGEWPSTPLLDQLDRLRPADDDDGALRRSRRRLTTAGLAVVAVAVGAMGMSSVIGSASGGADGSEVPVVAAPSSPTTASSLREAGTATGRDAAGDATPMSTTTTTPAVPVPAGEADATGPVVEHEGRRYQVGEPGDLTAVADWRCDGRQTLALHRPSSGATFVFHTWPRPGERAETTAVAVTPGGTALQPGVDPDGCPTLAVVGLDGPLTTLTVEDLR